MSTMDYAKAYSELHQRSDKAFSGLSLLPHVPAITQLVLKTRAQRLLDYGSGRGYQYLAKRAHEAWGNILPVCYDVGVPLLSTKPQGPFDGAICSDVMEHIAEEDVPSVLADIFGLLTPLPAVPEEYRRGGPGVFAFFSISCKPAKHKTLPDGRNVHLTVKPPSWWNAHLVKHDRDGLLIQIVYIE